VFTNFHHNLTSSFKQLSIKIICQAPSTCQQQCRSNVRLWRRPSNIRLCCQKGNNFERVYRKISSFRQGQMFLRHCCRYLATVLRRLLGNNVERVFSWNFFLWRMTLLSTLLQKRQQCRRDIVTSRLRCACREMAAFLLPNQNLLSFRRHRFRTAGFKFWPFVVISGDFWLHFSCVISTSVRKFVATIVFSNPYFLWGV